MTNATMTSKQAEFTLAKEFRDIEIGQEFAFAPAYLNARDGSRNGSDIRLASPLGVYFKTSPRKYVGSDGLERSIGLVRTPALIHS